MRMAAGAFVGREDELAELLGGLDDVFAGRGRLFLISGEPGIGKSRLADELTTRAAARGAGMVVGRCWEAGGAPAFWPWVQVIRTRVRGRDPEAVRSELGAGAPLVAQIVPELRELLPDLPEPLSLESEGARFQLFEAVATFLHRSSEAQPLVVVLDDLHAADEPSLLLVQFVARELRDQRMLLVGAYRDVDPTLAEPLTTTLAELAREPATRLLELGGLGESDVGRFIELTTAHTPATSLVETVHAETEGNPLFVGEIVRLLAAEGRLDEPAPQLAVPQSVKDVIGRRLCHLSTECNRVLTLASVMGREFDLDALAHVSGLAGTSLLELLDGAIAERVVSEMPGIDGRLRFAHALIRDTLYEGLPVNRRMQLHLQVGETLETLHAEDIDPHLAELALHFFLAAPIGDGDRAIDYARRAGDRAVRLLAYEEARRLYEMALTLDPGDAVRCDLMLLLGDAQARAGDEPAAKETFLQAADLARRSATPDHFARGALGYGGRFVWARAGTDEHLVRLLEEALAALGTEDSDLRVRVLARLAGALRDQPDREPRARLSDEAVEVARRIGDPATLAYALDGRCMATFWVENTQERIALATELMRLADEIGDRERAAAACYYGMMFQLELGDMPAVEAGLAAYAARADELRQPAQFWLLVVTRATLALFQGRYEEGERLMEEALALGGPAQRSDALLSYRIQRFTLAKESGGLEDVEREIRASVDEYPARPMFRCMLASLYTDLGREQQAGEPFEQLAADDFEALPLTNEWLFSLGFLAEVAAFLGDVDRSGTLYELLLPYATRNASTADYIATGSVSRPLGILASAMSRWEEAASHFETALAMNERMGARPWVARTQYDNARMLLERDQPGDRERATELVRAALDTARELGMGPLAEQAAEMLSRDEASAGRFAGYRIEEPVGRGGMGVVYRATDLHLERPVALKLVAPEYADDPGFRDRFLRESRLAASLDHPAVVPIYEAGESEGKLFIAMRYVDGSDLKTLLAAEHRLAPERALAVCGRVAAALDTAHRRGLVHRDVKPANVLLDEGEHPYLADFGLTKQVGDSSTQAGQLVGTLDYLAPEQIRGDKLDGRADQYALACVLYECLAGAPPHRRPTEAEALWAHMQEDPPPLRDFPQLDGVLARGLAKRKEERYATCAQLVDAAREALGLETPRLRRKRRLIRRSRVLLAAGALVFGGGIAAAVVELTGGSGGIALARPNSVAVIDPKTNALVADIGVGSAPSSIAVGEGGVWALNADDQTVSRLDPHTKKVVRTFSVGATPTDLAVGAGSVWVADGPQSTLTRIDPGSTAVLRTIRLPRLGPTSGLAVAVGGGVWAAREKANVVRVDPATDAVTARIRSLNGGGSPGGAQVAVGAGAVWVSDGEGLVTKIDSSTNAPVDSVVLAEGSGDFGDIATGFGAVWVSDTGNGRVWEIDPGPAAVARTFTVGTNPVGLAVGERAVWTANSTDGTVSRLDPFSGRVTTIRIGATPDGIALGGGRVWVTVD